MELKAQWMANLIVEDTTGEMLEYRHLIKQENYKDLWEGGMCRELGRLTQGYRDTKGTNTVFFIPISKVQRGGRSHI